MAEDVHITPEGLEAVRKEHEELVSVRRPAIASKIKAARELGDLSENFEYHAAKNEQGFMEARINELEQIIKNHVLIEKPGRSELVAMGSTVRFREDGEDEEMYRIVGPAEAVERLRALVVRASAATLIVPAIEREAAVRSALDVGVVSWRDGEDPYALVRDGLEGLRHIAVEKDHVTLKTFESLQALVGVG